MVSAPQIDNGMREVAFSVAKHLRQFIRYINPPGKASHMTGTTPLKQQTSILIALLFVGLSGLSVAAQSVPSQEPLSVRRAEPATVVIWNRPIVTLRAAVGSLDPSVRAANVRQRIESLPYTALGEQVTVSRARIGQLEGVMLQVGAQNIVGLLPEDLDHESRQTLDEVGEAAAAQLREVLRVRAEQRRLPVLLRGIGLSLLATIALALALWGITRLYRNARNRLDKAKGRHLTVGNIDLSPFLSSIERGLIKLTAFGLGVVAGYLWLTFVLLQFPYSQPWGERVGTYLYSVLAQLGIGALAAMPGLFTVLLIFVITRVIVRIVTGVLVSAEESRLRLSWMDPDTAKATRRILVILIWVFAVIVAYPYIPGSNSDAFKGVSVFIGLIISLGSAGLVNQIMHGLVVVYSRALRPGDYVKTGDTVGHVTHLGFLSIKIRTPWREEITIPHAVLTASTVTNYTRLVGGAFVSTPVTIGYDTPWRQVHAMLKLAAARTPGVRKDPEPRILQRALSDYYVEYELFAALDHPDDRFRVLSDLHEQIQDAFNEFGVQIMSPHFRRQPEEKVVVDKSQWYATPAVPPGPEN